MDSLERQSIDARFSIRGDRPAPKEIVFVAIDDVTTSYFGKTRWPYPRRYHAKVINRINARPPARDRGRHPVHRADGPARRQRPDRLGRERTRTSSSSTTETLPNGATRIFGGNETLREIGAKPASGLFPTDSAGVIRKVKYAVNGLKTLAVVTVETATGHPVAARPLRERGRVDRLRRPVRELHALLVLERLQAAASRRAPSGARSSSSAPPRRGCRTSTRRPSTR